MPPTPGLHYWIIIRADLFDRTTGTDVAARVLAPFREVPVDRAIAESAARIRGERVCGCRMRSIAATALERNLGLATRNKRHFARVRGLRIRALN